MGFKSFTFTGRIPGKAGLALAILLALLWTPAGASAAAKPGSGAVVHSTLRNGLKVVIVRNTLAPVVTTVVNYLVGSHEEPPEFPGIAHAQEHMMFRGSPGLSGDQLSSILASLGGIINAHTRQTVTQYVLTVPSDDLDVALHIESVRMQGVIDSERLWCSERGAIEQEVAGDISDPEFLSGSEVSSRLFAGTPYEHSPLGSASSFEKMDAAMLKKFYDTWYAPNNAILVIVGNVQPSKVLSRVRAFFETIPRKKIPRDPEICLRPVEPATLRLKTDQSYGLATIAFRMPGTDNPDYPASQILADVLSSQRGRLFSLVPDGKALYAGFTLNPLPCAGSGTAVAAFPRGAHGRVLLEEMRTILSKEVERGFSPDLIEAAKRVRLTKTELKKNSIQGLAMAWSSAVAINGRRSPEEETRALMRVSAADVDRVARKYLDLDHAVASVLTPESSDKPAVAAAASPPAEASESFAPEETRSVALPGWAAKAMNKLTIPAFAVRPFAVTLPNGLRLIVQRVGVSNTVSLYGRVSNRPEREAPQGKDGVDQALEQLFAYGTTTLDRVAFQKALDRIGAKESAGLDFTLQTLDSHFEQGVKLLAENQLRPALPEEGFQAVRKLLLETVAGNLHSPDHLARRAARSALFPPGDPALRLPTTETVSSLTLNDVKAYYGKVMRPDLTTIVVIGKITPKRARTIIERYFGSWTASRPTPSLALPSVPPNRASSSFIPDLSRVQDEVTLVETLGAPRSYPDFYALMLGNYVLGGTTCAARLYRELREEKGLVYYVTSSLRARKTHPVYQIRYGCSPSDAPKVRSVVERSVAAMQTKPVDEGELRRAKALLLRQLSLAESSVDRIASGLSYRAAHDPPLEDPVEAARKYVKLTAEQVREAFAKWLRPSDFAEIIKGPPR